MNEPDFNQLKIEIVPDGFWIVAVNGDFPPSVPIWCRYEVGGAWQETTVTLPAAGGVPLLKLFWRPKQRLFVYTGSRPRRVVLNGTVDSASQSATQFLSETYAQRQARYSYWRDDSSFTVYPDYSDPIWMETNWPSTPSAAEPDPIPAPAAVPPPVPSEGESFTSEPSTQVPPTAAAGGFGSPGGIEIESTGRAAEWASPGSSAPLIEEPEPARVEASSPVAEPPLVPGVQADAPPAEAASDLTQQSTVSDPPLFPGVQTDAPPAEASSADTQQSTY